MIYIKVPKLFCRSKRNDELPSKGRVAVSNNIIINHRIKYVIVGCGRADQMMTGHSGNNK